MTSVSKGENGLLFRFYTRLRLTNKYIILPWKTKVSSSALLLQIAQSTKATLTHQTAQHHSYTQPYQSPHINLNLHTQDIATTATPSMSDMFAGHLAISYIGNICYLLPQVYLAMLMPPHLQIMASLIIDGIIWVFLLPICRFSWLTTYISEPHYKKLIVSYMLNLQP
jgi:hypothetical protein